MTNVFLYKYIQTSKGIMTNAVLYMFIKVQVHPNFFQAPGPPSITSSTTLNPITILAFWLSSNFPSLH